MVLAALLIAACAIFYWTTSGFDLKLSFVWGLAALVTAWGVHDAWRSRQGALHYAAGEWVLALGESESQGALQVVLDLQQYLLVRFIPSGHQLATSQYLKIKGQWLHLENGYGQDWLALRRALYAVPASPFSAPLVTQPGASAATAGLASAASPV
jgi:hypothetical protein